MNHINTTNAIAVHISDMRFKSCLTLKGLKKGNSMLNACYLAKLQIKYVIINQFNFK